MQIQILHVNYFFLKLIAEFFFLKERIRGWGFRPASTGSGRGTTSFGVQNIIIIIFYYYFYF